MLMIQLATDFLMKEAEFVYNLYQAAELEVRATERYVLVGLGGMYSYLATKDVPIRFRRMAWRAPIFVVGFAGVRAFGLGWRQGELLRYLRDTVEPKLLGRDAGAGWAHSFLAGEPIVAISAGIFYALLAALTIVIAHRMTTPPTTNRTTSDDKEA